MLVSRSRNKVLSETYVLVEREKDEQKDVVNPVEILIKRNNEVVWWRKECWECIQNRGSGRTLKGV